MAKKIGVCKNIDCEHYNEHIEIETGAEMECPFCHQPLKMQDGNSGKGNGAGNSKIKYIVGACIVVLAIGGGAIALMPSSEKVESDAIETPAIVAEDTVVNNETEKVPEEKPEVIQKENNALVTGRGTIKLSYGSYTGDLKNGKPHGYGVITYTKSQKIVPSKKFVANPGDKFEGDFRDGKISGLGYWIHEGNKTVVKP